MSKIKLDRELVLSKLKKVIKFVPKKPIMPAYENFKLTVRGGMMEIAATDGNIQVKIVVPVVSKEDLMVCIPAEWLVENLSKYQENEVILTKKTDTKVEIKCGKSKGSISLDCQPAEFPQMTMLEPKAEINLHQFFLSKSLKMTEKFVDDKNKRENLIGININIIDTEIVVTGADGFIMCRYAIKPLSIGNWSSVVVPTETASKVSSLLSDKGEVGLIHNGNMISFFTAKDHEDNFEVMSVLSNAKFPNTESLFEKQHESTIILNTLEMRFAIQRLALYGMMKNDSFVMKNVEEDQNSILLFLDNRTMDRYSEETLSTPEALVAPLMKAFGTDHFLQIINNIDAIEFEFRFSESNKMPCGVIPRVFSDEERLSSFLIMSRQE